VLTYRGNFPHALQGVDWKNIDFAFAAVTRASFME